MVDKLKSLATNQPINIINLSTNPRPRSTMDSIRVSEAPDTGSIPVEATSHGHVCTGNCQTKLSFQYWVFLRFPRRNDQSVLS